MAQLVLKGHSTRSIEVIELLVMLGAKNQYKGTFKGFYYWIEDEQVTSSDVPPENSIIFSLEEFLEKYPYKVGDNVGYYVGMLLKKETHTIIGMRWDSDKCRIRYHLNNCAVIGVEDILYIIEYKTEQSKQKNIKGMDNLTMTNEEAEKYTIKIPEFQQSINLSHLNLDEIELHLGDYEIEVRDGKTYAVKKKLKYPTTYVECCDILGIPSQKMYIDTHYANADRLFERLYKLYICRNAYWKIFGEELGLGKPWEPDWGNLSVNHEFVKINQGCFTYSSRVLVFPTAEMRDEFYENFKELIEECKELL